MEVGTQECLRTVSRAVQRIAGNEGKRVREKEGGRIDIFRRQESGVVVRGREP